MNLNVTMLAQGIAFFAFIWFTMKVVWPHLLRAIETRQQQIADGLAAAEKGKQELANAAKGAEQELSAARARAAEIVAQAEKRRAEIVEGAKAEATAEADRVKAAGLADLEQSVTRAKESLREQVASLAVAGAEKILRREVDANAHAQMLTQLKQEL